MAEITASVPELAQVLRAWLVAGKADVGGVSVRDVGVGWDEDAEGAPILRFNVRLADPAGDTWPIDDVVTFHRWVEEHAAEIDLDAPFYVGLESETAEEFDES